MEILVSTTIFTVLVAALMTMFNYTIKINRRTEALRQATQGMRDMVEFIAKEVRNGQLDYRVGNGQTALTAVGPCTPPSINVVGPVVSSTYSLKDNRFAILTPEGDLECFYLAYGPGNTAGRAIGDYVDTIANPVVPVTFTSTLTNPNPVIAMKKNDLPVEIVTPPNMSIKQLYFGVRPTCDPYSRFCEAPYSGLPLYQPLLTMVIQFKVLLPTGESTDIYYQTTVAGTKYDIPNQ